MLDILRNIPLNELGRTSAAIGLGVTGAASEYTATTIADAILQDHQRPALVSHDPNFSLDFGPRIAYAVDVKCKGQTVPFEIVGKQVPFIDLERWGLGDVRPGIFDKGVKTPLDPYIEKPALGGQMVATSLDGKTEYQRDLFKQEAPKISYVPGLDKNVAYAHVKFNVICNDDYVKPDGSIVPGLNLTLVSTQHPENTSYKTKIASGAVDVEWFGRELGVEHKTTDGKKETILHPEAIDRILKDPLEPVRDLNAKTRTELHQSIQEALKKQGTSQSINKSSIVNPSIPGKVEYNQDDIKELIADLLPWLLAAGFAAGVAILLLALRRSRRNNQDDENDNGRPVRKGHRGRADRYGSDAEGYRYNSADLAYTGHVHVEVEEPPTIRAVVTPGKPTIKIEGQ